MKVAIVHEWLVNYAGSERVLEQLLLMYPQADLFAVCDFLPNDERGFLHGRPPKTTFIQNLPLARKYFRSYLPLMPLAIEQLDMSAYDLVISSNHAVAKGVITGPNQVHVCYVHSPMRYAWDLQHQYLEESRMASGVKSIVARTLLHYLRNWDRSSAVGVDYFIANSNFIAKRIEKVYRRAAVTIYPPVNLEKFQPCEGKEDFYLSASRLVPYKRVPIIVEAFASMPDRRLIVIGEGPDFLRLKRELPSNVELLGFQPTPKLVDYMQRARAMVFAAEEDFGIAPVEAQACGTPVIAYGRGGALESVQATGDHPTGLFFATQTPTAILNAVQAFSNMHSRMLPEDCRRNAERFSEAVFRQQMQAALGAMQERQPVFAVQESTRPSLLPKRECA